MRGQHRNNEGSQRLTFSSIVLGLTIACMLGCFLLGIATRINTVDWPEVVMRNHFGAAWKEVMRDAAKTNRMQYERMQIIFDQNIR